MPDISNVEYADKKYPTLNWKPSVIIPKRLIKVESVVHASIKSKPAEYVFPGEMHDFWEFILVTGGKAIAYADEKMYELTPGTLLVHKPLEFHKIRSDSPNGMDLVIGSFELSGELTDFFRDKIFYLTDEQEKLFRKSIGILSEVYEKFPTVDQPSLCEGALLFELFLVRQYRLGRDMHESSAHEIENDRYRLILETLNANCDKKLSLSDTARLCGMSVSLMKKVFSEHSDCGVMSCFSKLKIRKALELLGSGLSISATAYALSYSSVEYFLFCFRRELGISPTEYLRMNKKQ